MHFGDEGEPTVGPRKSHHRFGDEGVLDRVESLEGLRVNQAIFVHALPGLSMQRLGNEGKVLVVISEVVAYPNESFSKRLREK